MLPVFLFSRRAHSFARAVCIPTRERGNEGDAGVWGDAGTWEREEKWFQLFGFFDELFRAKPAEELVAK